MRREHIASVLGNFTGCPFQFKFATLPFKSVGMAGHLRIYLMNARRCLRLRSSDMFACVVPSYTERLADKLTQIHANKDNRNSSFAFPETL